MKTTFDITDHKYIEIKEQLIEGVTEHNVHKIEGALSNFNEYIYKSFAHIKASDDLKLHRHYVSVLSDYVGNLLVEPIRIAAKDKSFSILYLLLMQLATEGFFWRNLLSIPKSIVNLNNQPVKALLNSIIIGQILFHLNRLTLDDPLLKFLEELKYAGLPKDRLQEVLVRAFAIYFQKKQYQRTANINHLIQRLSEKKFINKNFEADLEKEQFSARLIHSLKDILYLGTANKLIDNIETNLAGVDINGDTALILAIGKSSIKEYQRIVHHLLKKAKIIVNQPGKAGMTPLMHAIKLNLSDQLSEKMLLDIIKVLLDKKADPNATDIFGKSVLDYAKESANDKIIKHIEESIQQLPILTQESINDQILALNSLNSILNSLANKL